MKILHFSFRLNFTFYDENVFDRFFSTNKRRRKYLIASKQQKWRLIEWKRADRGIRRGKNAQAGTALIDDRFLKTLNRTNRRVYTVHSGSFVIGDPRFQRIDNLRGQTLGNSRCNFEKVSLSCCTGQYLTF